MQWFYKNPLSIDSTAPEVKIRKVCHHLDILLLSSKAHAAEGYMQVWSLLML